MKSIEHTRAANDRAVYRAAVERACAAYENAMKNGGGPLRSAIGALLADETIGAMETLLAIAEILDDTEGQRAVLRKRAV